MNFMNRLPEWLLYLLCAYGFLRYALYLRSIQMRSVLEKRLAFLLIMLSGVCILRIIDDIQGNSNELLLVLTRITWSFVAFTCCLLVEAVKRRHFPRWGKNLIFGLFLVMLLMSIFNLPRFTAWGAKTIVLQGTLLLVCAFVATVFRDRKDITPVENYLLDSLQLSAGIAIAFTSYEFFLRKELSQEYVMRSSPIAGLVLVSCFARISKGNEKIQSLIIEQLKIILKMTVVCVSILYAVMGHFDARVFINLLTLLWGLRLVVAISEYVHYRYGEHVNAEQMLKISAMQGSSIEQFLSTLRTLPWFADFDLVSENEILPELRAVIQDFYGKNRGEIFSLTVMNEKSTLDGFSAEDIVCNILKRHRRTHAICISTQPLTLLLVTLPEVVGGPTSEMRFSMIQRLALDLKVG